MRRVQGDASHAGRVALTIGLLALLTACGVTTPAQTAATPLPVTGTPARSATTGQLTPPADTATIHIDSSGKWTPASASIRPGASVTWENDDPASAHPVACVAAQSSAPCPWQGQLALPAAHTDSAGHTAPSVVSQRFPQPGLFVFRDALHTTAQGQVIVGAP